MVNNTSTESDLTHHSVMLSEAVDGLCIKADGVYVDGTFGRGGHSRLILAKLGKTGRLYAFDRDPQAIEAAQGITDTRFEVIHAPFSDLQQVMSARGLNGKIDGVLLDLGLSSPQLDDAERGFSFMRDGPLDMRMDTTRGLSAAEWLVGAKEFDIYWVLKNYGEERFARRIARAIVERNGQDPMTRTKELAAVIAQAMPVKDKFKHPATRSFQAIRIKINGELKELESVLESAVNLLANKGRLSVISFHSLEDRIVKRFMREKSRGPQVPAKIPVTEAQRCGGNIPPLKVIGKKMPSEVERQTNPRSRSAVLRVAEKVSV